MALPVERSQANLRRLSFLEGTETLQNQNTGALSIPATATSASTTSTSAARPTLRTSTESLAGFNAESGANLRAFLMQKLRPAEDAASTSLLTEDANDGKRNCLDVAADWVRNASDADRANSDLVFLADDRAGAEGRSGHVVIRQGEQILDPASGKTYPDLSSYLKENSHYQPAGSVPATAAEKIFAAPPGSPERKAALAEAKVPESLQEMMVADPAYTKEQADKDAKTLHDAVDGMGTDEDKIWKVLETKTPENLALLRQSYQEKYKKDMDGELRSDFSGDDLERLNGLLLGKADGANFSKAHADHAAETLHEAVSGFGTDEEAVFRTLEGKTPENLDLIRQSYQEKYKTNLDKDLRSDFGGDELKRLDDLLGSSEAKALKTNLDTRHGELARGGADMGDKDKKDNGPVEALQVVKDLSPTINEKAKKYGLPPALVAGVMASEVDFDTPWAALDRNDGSSIAHLKMLASSSQGVCRVKPESRDAAKAYLMKPEVQKDLEGIPGAAGLKDFTAGMDGDSESTEGAAVMSLALAHQLWSGGRAAGSIDAGTSFKSFLDNMTPSQMATVYGAYRNGAKGWGGDPENGTGFTNYDPALGAYKPNGPETDERARKAGAPRVAMGTDAYQSELYFEYFAKNGV